MKTKIIGLILCTGLIAACSNSNKTQNEEPQSVNKPQNAIGGSDAAMGYTYSKLLDKKIRTFEVGIKVLPIAKESSMVLAGYLVLSPDSNKIEIFLPEESMILDQKRQSKEETVWETPSKGTYKVEFVKGIWKVFKEKQLIYSSEETKK